MYIFVFLCICLKWGKNSVENGGKWEKKEKIGENMGKRGKNGGKIRKMAEIIGMKWGQIGNKDVMPVPL